jgi:1-acyl-sn-glycerol-3-phosphate acyltransferase
MIQLYSSEQTQEISTPTKVPSITSRISPWLTRVVYPLGRFGLLPFYFGQLEITGQENLPTDGPVILAPTHRSRWDALIVPYACGLHVTGRNLRFMVSANEIKGLQGWFIRRLGGFPVDTDQPGIGSFRHGVELLVNGEMLVIFPEGNIFRDNGVQPLKRGLARIALQVESSQPGLGVKIVPISIKYSQSIPRWGCNVKVNIGSPLPVADYCTDSAKRSARQLTADLETALKSLDEEKVVADESIAESVL